MVRRESQESENSSAMRMNIAASRPMVRARPCCSLGSFPASTEMKMMLSTPRTTSSAVSVSSATQISGLAIQSIGHLLERADSSSINEPGHPATSGAWRQ